MPTEELTRFMIELAERSGELIARHFLSKSLAVDLKPDRTVVTQADREAEELIRGMIRKRYPSHGVIGEEFGSERNDAEHVWVIDPIDGTLSFVSGVPLFGTLIGLLSGGEPILGCIHQPVVKLLCIGNNSETRLNGVHSKARSTSAIEDAVLLLTDRSNIGKFQPQSPFAGLEEEVKLVRTWGDCYGYLLLAAGRADIMLDPVMNPWDILPVIPVVRGAGAVISGWNGEPAARARSAVAATSGLHGAVLERLKADV